MWLARLEARLREIVRKLPRLRGRFRILVSSRGWSIIDLVDRRRLTLLELILLNQGVSFLIHYLDDYLKMGPPNSPECHCNLSLLIEVCAMLGIPLVLGKVEGPSMVLCFLGILLDTTRMEARLPNDKLTRIATMIKQWLQKRNATKREILSFVGLLRHAAGTHVRKPHVQCGSKRTGAGLLHSSKQS